MRFGKVFTVLDYHAMGEETRVIISGLPHIPGKTMMEKCEYSSKNLGYIEDILHNEPRGKKGIISALTPPTTDDADFGYLWIMRSFEEARLFCGHGTLGLVRAIVDTGLVKPEDPVTVVKLDSPLGRVTGYAHIKNGEIDHITVRLSWGCFLQESFTLDLPRIGKVPVDIGFSGRYLAFMQSDDIGVKVKLENVPTLVAIATEAAPLIRAKVKELGIKHPDWPDIQWSTPIIIEDEPTLPGADHKNATILPAPTHLFDRSPCGSGTCANMGILYNKGRLGLNQEWVNENLMGTSTFTGSLVSETKVGEFDAAIPEFTGNAYMTAMSTVFIDPNDPYHHGFEQLNDPELAKMFQGGL